ncbi:MAG: DEAD/DEAH box helicase [Candidatus Hydrogenedentes bacterium]|nr:DEAD/DEAH box helicase [Candidatus Hydrogenedentota bacterium]
MSFDQFNLDPTCLHLLKKLGITVPTPVQVQAIPAALEGRDVLAISQTGTGKTFAFGLPAMTALDTKNQPWRNRILVLTPTRELAHQIHDVLKPFAAALNLKSVCLYGGVGMEPQTRALRNGCSIIIATPGRLQDHMDRNNVKFTHLSTLVLDEADRMLDMGFLPAIKRILSALPKERQTMLFSATFPKEIEGITAQFMRNPLRIQVAATNEPTKAVRQGLYTVLSDGKLGLLRQILEKPEVESAIVFMRTKVRTDRVSKALEKTGIKVQAIHGDRSQRQRQQAIEGFRKGHYQVLVATDVAARGIDVQGITHVVNYDIPMTFDDYIHRIGRTARANAKGDAITFVSPDEYKELHELEKNLGMAIPQYAWEGSVEMHTHSHGQRKSASPQRGGGGGGRKPVTTHGRRSASSGGRDFRANDGRQAQSPRGEGRGANESRGDAHRVLEPRGEGRPQQDRRDSAEGRVERAPRSEAHTGRNEGSRASAPREGNRPFAPKGPRTGGYGSAGGSKGVKKSFNPGNRGSSRSR